MKLREKKEGRDDPSHTVDEKVYAKDLYQKGMST